MPTTRLEAAWTREHSDAQDLGRAVLRGNRDAGTALSSDENDDVRFSGSQSVAPRSRLLGAYGGLDRILMTLRRRPYQGPGDRGRARANADRLVETIRALSAL